MAIHRPVVEEMLAAVQRVPRFRGGYWFRSAEDRSRRASVLFCDTREQAEAAHETSMAIMRKHQPNITVRVAASGKTAVLAMA